ncbi:Piso0_001896 [Millerozyma farinosa CBS 7064]|uniref:Piso0_001896 protein n=1 Tax=Pichia sorbitophila (strain ATCC MYA-4447 / BCRC 22081 / CBS 7064 / NBRC 10061 / NRRL Y-12695) TaxID=559304 RepID=G8YB53_PICSO|nr:Piso0_001896 [Millerozyma farinosa CBS 7064]
MVMSVHNPLMRKRNSSISSPNFLEGATPAKKQRNEKEGGNEMTIESGQNHNFSSKMYSAYVNTALEALEKNEPGQVEALTSKINLPISHSQAISIPNLSIVLKLLISNISRLENSACANLITGILRYNWLEVKETDYSPATYKDFIDLYAQFLSVLVSSFPKYLNEVLIKVTSEFVFFQENEHLGIKHHDILSKLIRFIPTCVNTLPSILHKNFPHHISSTTSDLKNYVSNLSQVLVYCPELQYDVWQLIIECCIKLDVELQNEIDDLDDDEIEELINEESDINEVNCEKLSSIDPKEENSNQTEKISIDSDNLSEDEIPEGEIEYLINPVSSTGNIKNLILKLDSLLFLVLNKTSDLFTIEKLNDGSGVFLFNTLTSLFKSHILPTHFTKSIQFVHFHISQYQPELMDSYLVLLIDIAFNIDEILEKRLKAMQYLSSYIARAKKLSKNQIVFVVSYLTGWLNKYVDERECEVLENKKERFRHKEMETRQSAGMERFKLFYAAFQALLYIFCFRHNSLFKEADAVYTEPSDSEWECEIDKFFQRMILVKFNPLKYCDETVVFIFAKISTKLNVCYCYSILEHNKRERMLQNDTSSMLPSSTTNFRQKQEFLDLEAYFPFDPLVLPQCKEIVGRNYIEWSSVDPSNDEDDEDDSGSHSDEEVFESDEESSSDEND